jgi:uncharacterized protein YacL (UPF0231 family)
LNATKTSDGQMALMHWLVEEIDKQRSKFLKNVAAASIVQSSTECASENEAGEAVKSFVTKGPLTAGLAPPEVLQLLNELEHVQAAAASQDNTSQLSADGSEHSEWYRSDSFRCACCVV